MLALTRLTVAVRVLFGCLVLAAAAARAEQSTGEQPTIVELVAATESADEGEQLAAIDALGHRGADAVPALSGLLKSDSPVVRAYALRALAHVGPAAKPATESVLAMLGDPEVTVRRQAIEALRNIRPGPKVAVPLFAKLMKDADPGVRLHVMEAVADAKGNAVPALVEALQNPDAAYWACIILRDIGPDAKDAVPALVATLKDEHPEVRREAALALAAIGSPDAAEAVVPLLAHRDTRTAATFALGALGTIPADAESTLRENVKSDDHLLATASLWALAKVHGDDKKLKAAALTQLIERLKDPDPYVRAGAARALASLPPSPEIAIPIFQKALADADPTTMHYMLDTLASLGPPAVPRLIAALEHKELRPQVTAILGRIGPAAAPATPALAELLSDEDPNVNVEAAHALAKIGPGAKAAVPALIEALKRPEAGLELAAAYALGRIGPAAKAADPALLELVGSHDDSVSLLCAWALVQIDGKSAATASNVLPELIVALESSQAKSREMAAETLESLGPLAKAALPKLRQATQDPDAAVREAAERAVKAIGD